MPSTPRPDGPRHMAGHRHRSDVVGPDGGTPATPATAESDTAEAGPIVQVHRHRLAFALAATVAALPILVLDNLPATADTGEQVITALPVTVTPFDAGVTTFTLTPTAPPTTLAPTTTEPAPTTTAPPLVRAAATPTPTPTTAPPVTSPPPTQPPTTQPPAPSGENGDPNDPATWDRMAECEASGNWAANTGNGYYGGLQFSLSTWQRYGGTGYPHKASKAVQIETGKRLQAAEGWGAWPACSRELGYT